jgi:threonine synthase
MRYYSTRNKTESFSFAQAALTGLAPDGGLFIPESVPVYRDAVKNSLDSMSFQEIAFETILPYMEGEIPRPALEELCAGAFSFGAPLIPVNSGDDQKISDMGSGKTPNVSGHLPLVLELFHGPTAAFKDFGARFMARAFSWLRRGEDKPLHILVATSGDTGGAVADGFFGVEGISVTVLYPRGRVSELQEKQIAGLGGNIGALAVEGSFDDCQALVKGAFGDAALREKLVLSSANSINISRLIPQAVYYTAAAGKALAGCWDNDGEATPRVGISAAGTSVSGASAAAVRPETVRPAPEKGKGSAGGPLRVCVPSGNFGNLTAGLYALAMGAPITGFIAATNINKTVPDYLESGEYKTRLSQATISNAMDVGAPSNFERMAAHWSYDQLRKMIRGVSVTDEETRAAIAEVYNKYGYYLDPHGAVGWRAVQKIRSGLPGDDEPTAVLATAHPAKFSETVEAITGAAPVPASIQKALGRTAKALVIPAELSALRDYLLEGISKNS